MREAWLLFPGLLPYDGVDQTVVRLWTTYLVGDIS